MSTETRDALREALGEALHAEWDLRVGEPSEPGVTCEHCADSAGRILAHSAMVAALRATDVASDPAHRFCVQSDPCWSEHKRAPDVPLAEGVARAMPGQSTRA